MAKDHQPGRRSYLFCVRSEDSTVHDRLVAAAREDGIRVPDLITRLLDLREQWDLLTAARHPLAAAAPVPPVVISPCRRRHVGEPAPPRARRQPVDGEDYWYGRDYYERELAKRELAVQKKEAGAS